MEITEPLRLAVGSQVAGTGYGCMMNVISWENGDSTITDMPACTNYHIACLVYEINDEGCQHTTDVPVTVTMEGKEYPDMISVLCPECSMKIMDAVHPAVGTDFKHYRGDVMHLSGAQFKWYIEGWRKIVKNLFPKGHSAWNGWDDYADVPGWDMDDVYSFLNGEIEGHYGLTAKLGLFSDILAEFKSVFADRLPKAVEMPFSLPQAIDKMREVSK